MQACQQHGIEVKCGGVQTDSIQPIVLAEVASEQLRLTCDSLTVQAELKT